MNELKTLEEMIEAKYWELDEFVEEYQNLTSDSQIRGTFSEFIQFSYDIFEDEKKILRSFGFLV